MAWLQQPISTSPTMRYRRDGSCRICWKRMEFTQAELVATMRTLFQDRYSDLDAGKARVEAKTALQFEKVLGVSAHIWLGFEKRYRLHQVRQAEAREAEVSTRIGLATSPSAN